MAILEKELLVDVSTSFSNYYEKKGYKIPRGLDKFGRSKIARGTKIVVKIDDLPEGSNARVTKICDECGEKVYNQLYSKIIWSRKRRW